MPRVVQVPDIRKVNLPEARQAIPYVHAYLRECILDGTLSPGTKLSQVSLAAQLGISRTPLREVLRMLQEEGLSRSSRTSGPGSRAWIRPSSTTFTRAGSCWRRWPCR